MTSEVMTSKPGFHVHTINENDNQMIIYVLFSLKIFQISAKGFICPMLKQYPTRTAILNWLPYSLKCKIFNPYHTIS